MPGTGFSRHPLIQLKIVVLAPMPNASVRIVMHAYPGALARTRRVYFRSCAKVDIGAPLGGTRVTGGAAEMFQVASPNQWVAFIGAAAGDEGGEKDGLSGGRRSSIAAPGSRCRRPAHSRHSPST